MQLCTATRTTKRTFLLSPRYYPLPKSSHVMKWAWALLFFPTHLPSQTLDAADNYNLPLAVAPGKQVAPLLVGDDQEGAYVIWQDERDDHQAVYAQHLNELSQPHWRQNGFAVAVSAKDQFAPVAIANGKGGVLIFWQDQRHDEGDIYGQQINREGKLLWGETGIAIIRAEGKQLEPHVVSDGKGGAFVLCRDFESGDEDVVAQHVDETGKILLESTGITIANGGGHQVLGDVAATPDGGVAVAWGDDRTGGSRVTAQRFDARLERQWANLPIILASGTQTAPIIYVTESNTFMVWRDTRNRHLDLYAQKINDNGVSQWGIGGLPVCRASGDQYNQHMIGDSGDGIFVVWEDARSRQSDIYGQHLSGAGKNLWKNDGIGIADVTLEQKQPQVTTDGSGGIICTWVDERGSGANIAAQRLDGNGKALWSKNGIFITNSNGNTQRPAILAQPGSLLGKSGSILAWEDTRNGNEDIFAQPLNGDGEFANVPPRIDSSPITEAYAGQLYTYSIQAIDFDSADPVRLELATAPTWLQIDQDKMQLRGTPSAGDAGENAIIVVVRDKLDATAEQRFSLNVLATNHPPQITSKPDTIAYVDSLYVYRVVVADADPGDKIQVIIAPQLPAWLLWNSTTNILQGKPDFRFAGETYFVHLMAKDVAGDSSTQLFRLHVLWPGGADNTAPASPKTLQIQPANWSTKNKFTLSWQNPVDPSHVAGAFYKIGAPPTSDRDGTFVPIASDASDVRLDIITPNEGKALVYLWLMDGRGNVDAHTAASIFYRYDGTPPLPPQNLDPDHQWARGDSVRFNWSAGVDTTSGIFRYQVFSDGEFIGEASGDTTNFVLKRPLAEKDFSWSLLAEDSAGNRSTPVHATFSVDRQPPILYHTHVDTTSAFADLDLSAQANDTRAGIREVRLYYRAAGEPGYRFKSMQHLSEQTSAVVFSSRIEAAQVSSKGVEYYLEAADSAGNLTRWPTETTRTYHAVVVNSSQVVAPVPFVPGRYQIFSVPYRLHDSSPAGLLEDDLGNYDQSVWRLFRYQPDIGNVEFGDPNLEPFAPGRAFWLITTHIQNYDIGPAQSVSTNEPFTITLQPGWNLIATPFDFPTAWRAVQRPQSVEDNLWGFDGTRYLGQQEILLPWHGYFLRNLEAQPQILVISPVAANRAEKTSHAHARSAAETIWHVQLRVSDGEFRDDDNYLGVAQNADETWDPLDFSEPPTIGDYVSLYFDRREWPRFPGFFTSDFRPADDKIHSWSFAVVSSRQVRRIELTYECVGDLPNDWVFVLEDISGHVRRQIVPATSTDGYNFIASREPRRFVWWVGSKNRLAEAGLLQDFIPEAFELAPSYPNPARIATASSPAAPNHLPIIQFSLPVAASVRLAVFDLAGRQVRVLLAGEKFDAGYHEKMWDGRDDDGRSVSAGIYIYRLDLPTFRASRKLILLR